MGISIVDKTADFSSISVGFGGLYTTVSTGLIALHELRDSTARTVNNAVSIDSSSFVIGTPVYSAGSITATPTNTVDFGVRPIGERSFAFITNIPSGVPSDFAFLTSTTKATPAVKGGDLCALYNSIAANTAYCYASATPPLVSGVAVKAELPVPSTNAFELIVVTVKNGVGVTVYHPRLGTSKLTAAAANMIFATDNTQTYKLLRDNTTGSANVAMFALWNRPLTASEVVQFYADIKPQMLVNGVVV